MSRHSFQQGCLLQVPLKSGAVWRFRWRDAGGTQHSEFVGTVASLPTKSQAWKATERYRVQINSNLEIITVADLIQKFWKEAAPERETTANSYRSIFKRIEADWGAMRLDEFARSVLAVQKWLEGLEVIGRHPKPGPKAKVSPLYRSQVRNLLHLLIEKGMLWGHIHAQRNPIELVRLKDSARQKEIITLSPELYRRLLDDPEIPLLVKTMVQVAAGLGMRVSEVLGLKWSDFDFEAGEVRIQRSAVKQQTLKTKTRGSAAKLPLHPELIAVLQMWREAAPVVKGWVFGSERTGRPYDRDYLRDTYLVPAGARLGVGPLGWHSFRHSYSALLRLGGASIEEQKALMRHARIATTMDIYGNRASVEELRPVNSKVVEMLQRKVG